MNDGSANPITSPAPSASYYAMGPATRYDIDDATFAVRRFGTGPNLVLIHGFPTHGYTWRKLLPELSRHFSCYVIDMPGLGDSDWRPDTDFSFTAQAHRLGRLCAALQLHKFSMIAHDTGATVARLVTLNAPLHVVKLVLINTEIPNHRPPWIPTYQRLAKLPGANRLFRFTMRSKRWQKSRLGLREFYTHRQLLDIDRNVGPYLNPVINSRKKMEGLLHYLQGIEWPVIDAMATRHREIIAPTLLLWGANDKTFPISLAREMCSQFKAPVQLIPIPASLLPHEERPGLVVAHVLNFFLGRDYSPGYM